MIRAALTALAWLLPALPAVAMVASLWALGLLSSP